VGNFCQTTPDLRQACAFHQAGAELHQATVNVLSRWTLEDFLRRPGPSDPEARHVPCWLRGPSALRPAALVASKTKRRPPVTSHHGRGRPRRGGES
jgi:hypothetical protein